MAKKVLFITEGDVDEIRLMVSICRDLSINSSEVEYYSYRTDFHQFARMILPDGAERIDENLDILLTLMSHEKDIERRKILSYKYVDIFIIFDFDPHGTLPEFEKMRALASFFISSSDMGRLFINYPMMQSYKHLTRLPDTEYGSRSVTISQIQKYKELVSKEGLAELVNAHEYSHVQLYEIAYHNYCKREKLLGREYAMKNVDKYNVLEDVKILDKQLSELKFSGLCSVLNTSSLIYLEYKPKQFLEEIIRHCQKFRI